MTKDSTQFMHQMRFVAADFSSRADDKFRP